MMVDGAALVAAVRQERMSMVQDVVYVVLLVVVQVVETAHRRHVGNGRSTAEFRPQNVVNAEL